MTLYFVSNNLVLDDIYYETDDTILEKRITRPLSIEGEKKAVQIVKKINADVIYSSNYASSLSTARYYAAYKNIGININSFLNDCKIGNLGSRNIKMLRYMQDRDFDFKFKDGESLNDVNTRMNLVIKRIIKNNYNKNIVIYTHKRAIMGYLLKELDQGYNLNDRLVLSFNDKVILDDIDNEIDIIKVDIEKNEIVNVDVL